MNPLSKVGLQHIKGGSFIGFIPKLVTAINGLLTAMNVDLSGIETDLSGMIISLASAVTERSAIQSKADAISGELGKMIVSDVISPSFIINTIVGIFTHVLSNVSTYFDQDEDEDEVYISPWS